MLFEYQVDCHLSRHRRNAAPLAARLKSTDPFGFFDVLQSALASLQFGQFAAAGPLT
jgi:hypothetical protein